MPEQLSAKVKAHPATSGRPVILTFVPYYLPGFKSGGPVRSLVNMIEALRAGFDFRIVTADRDAGEPQSYSNIHVDQWNEVQGTPVFYVSPESRRFSTILRLIRETPHDIRYHNSFFDPFGTFYPLVAQSLGLVARSPTVIAPRGEFSPGALALNHRKKSVYCSTVRLLRLPRGVIWHASTDYDAEDIHRAIAAPRNQIIVASNISRSALEDTIAIQRKQGAPLRVCFVSRISPKKNLDYALTLLAQVQLPIVFDIYGPTEGELYWEHCQQLMQLVREPVLATYKGPIAHADVSKVLAGYDLLLFPTRGENFGHIIAESMLAGTPVLISDQTPWRNLEAAGVGWDLPLTEPEQFISALKTSIALNEEEYLLRRERVRAYALAAFRNSTAIAGTERLFTTALSAHATQQFQ